MTAKPSRCSYASLTGISLLASGLILLLLIVALPGRAAAQTDDLRLPVRFAIIGDRTGSHEPGIHEEIISEIERMKPDFVVGVGDMIEGYTGDIAAIEEEWKEYSALISPFTMPFYRVPGNHDIWDSTSNDLYKRRVGEPYYSFDAGPIHFIMLDTSRWPTVSNFPQEQMDWLLSDLVESRGAKYTIAAYHIPYWIETVAKGKPDPLHDVLADHGVDAVFTGHYHVYFSGKYDGIAYTGVGSSGGGCEPGLTGLKYHFTWVTVDEEGISVAPVRMGSVLPWDEVSAETFNLVGRIEREALRIDKIAVGTDAYVTETDFAVQVKNFSSDSTLKGMLEWKVEGAWSVRPKRLPVEIAPGLTLEARFEARTSGPMYPVPTVTMAYPYDGRNTVDIEVPLGLVRTAYAHRAEAPIVIDGKVDETVWGDPVRDLFTGEGFTAMADSTRFYFAWDEANLYIGAVCMEMEMASLAATATEHDGAIFGEDCVGFFLEPLVPDGPLYQIYFNPLGTAFDQKISVVEGRYTDVDPEWDGSYDVAVSRGRDRWSIEIGIPLNQLGTEGEYESRWAVNFRRKQKRLDTSADWQVPIGYDPVDYGYLIMQ